MYLMQKKRTSTFSRTRVPEKVQILEGVLNSVLVGAVPYSKIVAVCSYHPPGYQFSKKYKMGVWDGRIRLCRLLPEGNVEFPSGLMYRIVEMLNSLGIKYEKKYDYKPIQKTSNQLRPPRKTSLRDYQVEAVKICINHRKGILKLPTGAGKTLAAASIIKTFRKGTIFLTHKKDLLYQTADVFRKEIGKDVVGIIGDGNREENIITVASIPTLYRNWKDLKHHAFTKEVMIADEVHHAKASTWYRVMMSIPAEVRIGLTATPLSTAERIMLEASTGPVIYTAKGEKLIDDGWLSKPLIYMVTVGGKLPERYDYQTAYENGIVNNDKRNDLIVRLCKFIKNKRKDLLPIVIQVRRLDHLSNIKRRLSKTNLSFRSIHGANHAETRIEAFKDVEGVNIDVLLTSAIFDEGIDIRNMRTLIAASGIKSDVKTIQLLGRGMRRTKTKSEIFVVDFFDTCSEYLSNHSKKRKAAYEKENHSVTRISVKKLKDALRQRTP